MSTIIDPGVANPYLTGNFGPVTEELTSFDLPVRGELPAELSGRFLRNGPNPRGETDAATYHWFTGDGMVHGIRLRDGQAEWYRNRWVRSPDMAARFDETPPPNPYGPDVGTFSANTNVIGFGGRTYAVVEAGSPPIELSDELETVGLTDFGGTLEHTFSAHPKLDPFTGELHVCVLLGLGQQDPLPRRRPRRQGDPQRGRRRSGRPDGARHRHERHGSRCSTCLACSTSTPPWAVPGSLTAGTPGTRRGSASCPATMAPTTSSGSTSTPATSSTRSTPTTAPTVRW